MENIFISYARADDEPFVEQLHNDLTKHGFDVWWDRQTMESRGLTFLQELRDAIEGSDRLIAVIGPNAVISDYVRAEWEHALLFSRGMVPILREGDYSLIPYELSKFHCPDFRRERPYNEALEELLRILSEPVPPLGSFLTAIPSLPPHFLPRRDEITRLGETVLADVQRPMVITSTRQTTALQGMGGVGKSVMAAAFARATETRRAFTDGIIWLTIGQKSDPSSNMLLVGMAFGDDPVNYVDIDTARARLPRVLFDKVCLIVLDDVWNVAHATPFVNALGPRCRLLITTRDGSLVTALGAEEHSLDVLTDAAALQLLANWCDQDVESLPSEAVLVANECGNLPLALALCGAMARDGTPWSDMLEALEEADLTFIEGKIPNYPYPDVLKALKVSVDALAKENPAAAEHYHKLAVFPADEAVPEAAVLTLWLHTDGLKERDARRLLTTLERKALLRLEGEVPCRLVSLHDLQYDYLRAVVGDMSSLHKRLLDAYQERCVDGWKSGPNDGYFFEHLAYHLVGAGRKDELREILFDFGWLQAKLDCVDVNSLITEYDYLSDDPELRLVQGAIRLSAHVLTMYKTQLAGHLLCRLQSFQEPGIQSMLKQACGLDGGPWLCPITASLTPPGGPLIRTLQSYEPVNAVAVTPDGRYAVAASRIAPSNHQGLLDPSNLTVWDIKTGEELRELEGRIGYVMAVTVAPDGHCAVVASGCTLKVWDIKTGKELRTLKHTHWINAVAVTPDGRYAVSASDDNILKVWDIETGEQIQTLKGHTDAVRAVAVTPDGRYAVSVSRDRTLKVWVIKTGKELRTLNNNSCLTNAVAVTPDGRFAVATSGPTPPSFNYILKVWNLKTGKQIHTLEGHTDEIRAVAVTPDGRYAVSASDDNTLKVWDIETGEQIQTLKGHTDAVRAVVVTPDGHCAVSASCDATLKVWDIEKGKQIQTPTGHTDAVTAVAVTPDGCCAFSASHDKTLKVWDIKTGKILRTLKGPMWGVNAVAMTLDGRCVASFLGDRTLKVLDIEKGKQIHTLKGHTDAVRAVAVTPDGHCAVSASDDMTLKVWDIETGEQIQTLKWYGAVTAVAVTSDGRYAVSASNDGYLTLWDIEIDQPIVLEGYRISSVCAIVVMPDDRYAVTASWDSTLKVWDLQTYNVIAVFRGDGVPFLTCTISPDGKTIVAGDASGSVHFLRLQGVE